MVSSFAGRRGAPTSVVLEKRGSNINLFSLDKQDLVQGKLLPGGEMSVLGDEIVYSTATKEYTGTYVCTGDNGEGDLATDKIMVTVRCEKGF